jgi:hypothetical protein
MKIIDIITTNESLNEALPGSVQAANALSHLNPMNWFRSAVSKATSGGFNKHLSVTDLINQTADEVAKYARSRGQNISDATKSFIEKMSYDIEKEVEEQLENQLRSGRIPSNTSAAAKDIIRKDLTDKAWDRANPLLNPRKNPEFWSAVQKKAERDFGANMIAGMGKGVSGVVGATGNLVKWGINAAYAAQIMQPFKDYMDRMAVADQWLKSGQVPPGQGNYKDVKEWYTAYRSQELTFAIAQAAGTWATVALGGAILGKVLKGLGGVTGELGPIWTTLGTAGKAYVASELRDSEGAKAVATVIADNAGLIGQGAGAAIDAMPVTSSIGSLVIDATTYFNRIGQGAKAADQGKQPEDNKAQPAGDKKPSAIDQTSQTGEKPTPNAQADASKPADAAKPANAATPYDFMGAKKVDPRWAPKEQWKDLGNGYIQDPNTGTIDVKL